MNKNVIIKFDPADYAYMDSLPAFGWLWEFERRSRKYKEAYAAEERGEGGYFKVTSPDKNLMFLTSRQYDPSKTWAELNPQISNKHVDATKIKPKEVKGKEDPRVPALIWKRYIIVYDLVTKYNLKPNKNIQTDKVIVALNDYDSLFNDKKNIERYYEAARKLIDEGGYQDLLTINFLDSTPAMQKALKQAKEQLAEDPNYARKIDREFNKIIKPTGKIEIEVKHPVASVRSKPETKKAGPEKRRRPNLPSR
jgi:hypothetical protein